MSKSQIKWNNHHFINWNNWHLISDIFRLNLCDESILTNWRWYATILCRCVMYTQRINWQNVWTERSSSYRHDLYVHWTQSHTELHKSSHTKPDSVLVYGQHLTCLWIATWAFGCLFVFDSKTISCLLCHYSNEYAVHAIVLMCWFVC